METMPVNAAARTVQVGPDQVTVTGTQVIINAVRAMPDWQVREYSRIPIYFEDRKYYLRQKSVAPPPYTVSYVLDPWPDEHREICKTGFTYDAEAVAQRDAAHRTGRQDEFIRCLLLCFYPVLGFLWSGTKEKLMRFGFVPRTITIVSIALNFAVVLLQGVFAKILLMMSLRTGHVALGGMLRAMIGQDHLVLGPIQVPVLALDIALFVAALFDLLARYTQHLRDAEISWGFLEWMFPRKKVVAEAVPVNAVILPTSSLSGVTPPPPIVPADRAA